MKPRSALTATEIVELHQFLDQKLERIGVPSRPEVALRLLELSGRANSEMRDYAAIIRTDHAMSGRVLRLANSALFAQRTPVTSLDRACLVLGIERIKAVTLGLQLSRAAAGAGARDISREVWGQSVFRACLAAESARVIAPTLVPEAFIIGLMLDCGVPLMSRLVGDGYPAMYGEARTPGALFRRENESLGFTHVDVVTVVTRRWRFPELLINPIQWHHTRPSDLQRTEPVHRLHKIAYVVGLIELDGDALVEHAQVKGTEATATTQRLLAVTGDEAAGIIARSLTEYAETIHLFSEVAAAISDLDSLIERVNAGLVTAIDDSIERSLQREEAAGPARVMVDGRSVELRRGEDGAVVAYLYDSQGQRLLAHRCRVPSAEEVAEAFGLELANAAERERLATFISRAAA
ncbi:MAG TPA: HDOD domain-containing protein [Phycisphaerales bacterium]|nr:HDOD domain-containing protein [Phycisphaerales bacterium]